ncbi:MAG: phosphate ABC transporter permease subunit PstC [Epulopiscium sp. Nele67-Bin005]|nr:MAG: phosphate ABC transporter permease subunit PstC [Epulopiscium sp. Nele67-Bin005]
MDKLMRYVFMGCAAVTILSISIIAGYVVANGVPFFAHTDLISFLTGKEWIPSGHIYGIYPMLVASILGTLGAVTIGVVIGISTAIVLVEILPPSLSSWLSKAIDLLAGIPSVVYGFFGLMVIVPLINKTWGGPGAGSSLLAVIFILGIMILPTIIRMTEVSLRAVPKEYKEGALALGATRLQYIFKVQLRAAQSGILAGIILGTGRALGETMAVMLVAGNTALVPDSILSPVRTLTANVALEMSYAMGTHQQALFATGLVLFALIMAINLLMQYILKRAGRN